MEKYLTPVQFEQFQLHQQVEATTPSVEMAFIAIALCVVIGLTTALIVNVLAARNKRELESAKRQSARRTLSQRIEREIADIEHAREFRETAEKNDRAYAREFGSAR